MEWRKWGKQVVHAQTRQAVGDIVPIAGLVESLIKDTGNVLPAILCTKTMLLLRSVLG